MFPPVLVSITEWMRETLSSSRQRFAADRRPILMMSRLKSRVPTRDFPLKILSVSGVGMVSFPCRLQHLLAKLFADSNQVRVGDLLASLDVLAVRPRQIALDGVVLEVDDRLLLVHDPAAGITGQRHCPRQQREEKQ